MTSSAAWQDGDPSSGLNVGEWADRRRLGAQLADMLTSRPTVAGVSHDGAGLFPVEVIKAQFPSLEAWRVAVVRCTKPGKFAGGHIRFYQGK
eukprot:3364271-Amphidinium_carterae.1